MNSRLTVNACLHCRRGVLPVQSLSRAQAILHRSLSTTSAAKPFNFTSYFFHNELWSPEAYHSQAIPASSVTDHSSPAPRPAYPPTHVPLGAFKSAPALTPSRLLTVYAQLSKSRLAILVILTAMSGVAVSPLPASVPVLLSTAVGTALCVASANTLNQLQEVPFDAQMARTRNRPLVRHAISPVHASAFAILTGVSGPVILWTMVNPTTALLGAANLALYAGPYTWMKRRTVWNTWVGAIVGAIPPLMGWTACGGALFPSATHPIATFLPPFLSAVPAVDLSLIANPLAPLALFMLHFSWQFPHFNSLSHFVRASYAQAGYRMLVVLDPAKNALVALRHAALMTGICSVLIPLSGLTTWAFALTSLVPNAVCVHAAWKFYKSGGEKQARKVFHHSLWYLPVILGLMMAHKQGVDWGKWIGLSGDEEEAGVSQSS